MARVGAVRFQAASTLAASRTAGLRLASLPGPKTFTNTGAEQSYRVPAGTVPSGQPIDTATTGTHTFTVHGAVGGKTVAGTVTYTVR